MRGEPHYNKMIIIPCTVGRRDIREMGLRAVISLELMMTLSLMPQRREMWQDLSIIPVMGVYIILCNDELHVCKYNNNYNIV